MLYKCFSRRRPPVAKPCMQHFILHVTIWSIFNMRAILINFAKFVQNLEAKHLQTWLH